MYIFKISNLSCFLKWEWYVSNVRYVSSKNQINRFNGKEISIDGPAMKI